MFKVAVMKFCTGIAAFSFVITANAATVNYVWNNTGTDMLNPSCYTAISTGEVSTSVPDSDDLVWFHGLPEKQPYLSGNLTLLGIRFADTNNVNSGKFYASKDDGLNGFNHCGWVISGAEGAVLTLTRWAHLGQSENNQAVINHCSYGTNRIECAISISDSSKISVSCGRLVLAGPVAQSESGTTQVMDAGETTAALVLAVANPDLKGVLQVPNGNLELGHNDAICAIKRLELTSSNGSGNKRYVRNVSGEEIVCDNQFVIQMNKCEATVFDGLPMRFSGAILAPWSGEKHEIYVNDSLTVGSVSNRYTDATGYVGALDYYGPGVLHILGGFCDGAPETQTNVLRSLGGTIALHKAGEYSRIPVAVGKKGTNSRTPRLGIACDIVVKPGMQPGGVFFYYENCDYGGWAAYDGDHTITFESTINEVLKLRGWKGDESGLSANVDWNGTDWWVTPDTFFFGAHDADGTITLAHDVDVNMGDSNEHFKLGAFQGEAFVAGRISGFVTNSVANFMHRKIIKEIGDGAVAIDGTVYVTGGHYVSSGGLLFNGLTAGSVTAMSGGWLGGTGMVHNISVESGGALRPGEQGGTLTSDGSVTFADGSSFVVDIGNAPDGTKINSCLNVVGSSVEMKAMGTITVEPKVNVELESGRRVKILDWTELSNPTDESLFDLTKWTVSFDSEVLSKAELSVDGTAMYLYVRPKAKPGFVLFVR